MGNDYLELDLRQLVITVLKKWWLLVLLFVVSAGTAYYISAYHIEPVYESGVVLFIGREQNDLAGIGISVDDLKIGSQLVKDYKQIAKTRYVIENVISEVGLDMSISTFRKSFTMNVLEDSRLFEVTFKSTNPEIARDTADELANQLSMAVAKIVEVENIQIIDHALVASKPISPKKLKNAFISGVLGVLGGLFIIFFIEMFKDTFKNHSEVEKELGLPIIGIIPEFKGEKR